MVHTSKFFPTDFSQKEKRTSHKSIQGCFHVRWPSGANLILRIANWKGCLKSHFTAKNSLALAEMRHIHLLNSLQSERSFPETSEGFGAVPSQRQRWIWTWHPPTSLKPGPLISLSIKSKSRKTFQQMTQTNRITSEDLDQANTLGLSLCGSCKVFCLN